VQYVKVPIFACLIITLGRRNEIFGTEEGAREWAHEHGMTGSERERGSILNECFSRPSHVVVHVVIQPIVVAETDSKLAAETPK
jgi:hypothetical protein